MTLSIGVLSGGSVSSAAPEGDFRVPTVGDCVEKTGKSESECSEMIGNIGAGRDREQVPRRMEEIKETSPESGHVAESTVVEVSEKKVNRFTPVGDRLENVIRILRESGADTSAMEESLEVFRRKSVETERAIDTLAAARDGADAVRFEAAKTLARDSVADIASFYGTFRGRLADGIRSISGGPYSGQ